MEKLIKKTNIGFDNKYHPVDLVSMFDDHQYICVLFKTIVQDFVQMESFSDENVEVIIIVYDEFDEDVYIPESLFFHHKQYELRFISSSVDVDDDGYK